MLTIGLLWHSVSSSNLGVGALTFSQLALVRQAAEQAGVQVQFKLMGGIRPHDNPPIPGIISEFPVYRNYFMPFRSRFVSEVKSCDLVLDIGEGDSFTDIYGVPRFALYTGTKIVVWLAGRKLILSPQTIGPFNRPWTRAVANFAMRRASRVFARDHMSRQYLQQHNIANADEAIDVAFALPFNRPEPSTAPAGGRIKFGINVSGLLYNGGYTKDNQFGLTLDYAKLTDATLDWLATRDDVEVHLVPHVLADELPVEDDRAVSIELMKRYPGLVLAPRFTSPSDAKSYIAGMDFFVGARMHACIAAFSSGVPVVPLAYSRKFNGLFESVGYHHYGDCKAASGEQVLALIKTSFEQRAQLKTEVDRGVAQAQTRLGRYKDFLTQTLRELHASKA
jgi:polysaccharide pyruvyl transferase WcaK-like protein